ncbi:23S rRNA (adenine(2503)-C(2))-methyltransferase RlmN [Pelagibacterium flavum]|uniref:23S rRNA (Adenine(2503)-C(2))-methyltransferase RlmN n=1 Tax=Pelagibacterium flavum TaxID=2984530 RepID=A0ABY6ILH6_9HYPH|nr:23S rRNA (adenine(2503)-C(2))-methyltransferase RlmN [Pelagibacterium sp. YIM 151497]MAN76323.1 RNA methyltransferase [Hyphomicrobiales bacterium]UYQ71448.1 23S rRNA (adenine(2503)-C(2))-methyltransferase RlmN [Pelagibacterium sp. YIM 151497]|tara:strand:+ start:3092 stop:4144 length:1053 start_codon:yes stop_codon:yes gene_type:complete
MSSAVLTRTAAASPRAAKKPFALDLDSAAFARLAASDGPTLSYRALFSPHADLPNNLKRWGEHHGTEMRRLMLKSRDRGTRSEKFLFALPDGYAIETVLIRRRDGYTACVSSQVGCAFACRFCASGQAGLKRNLSAGEIVEQIVRLGPRVNRIVFMGIGEPLNNYDNVLKAIRILRDRAGLALPASGMTISTIGIPKALKALREEHLKINLTISLHATTQETRAALIPGAKKHDIGEVVARALSWAERHSRIVTFVYLVLPGINDTHADLDRLCAMFAGQPARINLMRWNPVDGVALRRTDDHTLAAFRHGLERAGIPVVVRDTQGRDITAACGQLWLRDLNGSPLATAR